MPATGPPQTEPFAARGALLAAAAEEVLPLPWGSAIRTPSLDRWWSLNAVRVERPAPDLSVAALLATARRLGSLQVEIWDSVTSERLLPGLEAAGVTDCSSRLMAHAGPPFPVDPRAEACDIEVFDELRRAWFEEEKWGEESIFAQDLAAARRLRDACGRAGFCVRDEDDRPVSMASRVGTMIEDVYTLPAHRGRGLGAAVVGAALGAGGTFLPTDVDGRAVAFYERLGFTTAGIVTSYRLKLAPSARQPCAEASSAAVRSRPPA